MGEANISGNTTSNRNTDLDELKDQPGINVWVQHQDELEAQALKELEILAAKEDGELSDSNKDAKPASNSGDALDIGTYIKRQEDLRKQQEHKRSLQVSEKSKNAARRVSKKHCHKRRSDSPSDLRSNKKMKMTAAIDQPEAPSNAADCSGSEYFPSDGNCSEAPEGSVPRRKCKSLRSHCGVKVVDDGLTMHYTARLKEYYQRLENEMEILQIEDRETCIEDVEISPGLKINAKIWSNLYSYQQDGVEWLWHLHQLSTGGLLGDEMGLGKTVQVIAFLYSINHSHVVSKYCRYMGLGATLIVCPTTVLHQWVQHFHEWAPEFRVAVLHQSGSYSGNKTQLIKNIFKAKGILITSYAGVLKHMGSLVELDWHYVILDEGHKIRNPAAKVSVAIKQFRTPHRLLLTGSPMQNNLQELWSLFDFINAGMLGSLPVFLDHFATPIMQGGYHNSTPIQEATALSMATALKNLISPYLLRRSKSEVRKDICLPYKSEQVLFCSLTNEQRDLYKGYLMSEHVNMILGRGSKNWCSENYARANTLVAIMTLRKICNHPDLYLEDVEDNFNIADSELPVEERHGYYKRSGKMIVVSALLKIWKRQKHRVLLFTQGRAMISVFEDFLEQQGYKFLKMDGTTSIGSRQILINTFNQDSTYDVFLLTTRVGGLGVNLTGANRVIIYDPDWNPATDTQARERAWRIGQEKQVTVYRLLSAGTIEEKMYQRQVWKQLLSNKVLLDPRTQKFFKTSDLFDLFSLQEQTDTSNLETANIFQNSRVSLQERIKEKKSSTSTSSIMISKDKVEQMKIMAQKIAKDIGNVEEEPKKKRPSAYELELEAEREQKAQQKRFMKSLTPQELLDYNKRKLLREEETGNKIDNFETSISFMDALQISEKSAGIYHDMKDEKLDLELAQSKYDSLADVIHTGSKSDSNKMRKCNVKAELNLDHVVVDKGDSLKPNEFSNAHCDRKDGKPETKSVPARNNSSSEATNSSERRRKKHKRKSKSKEDTVTDKSGEVDGEKIAGLLKLEIKRNERRRDRQKLESQSQDQYVLEKLFSKKGVHTALLHDTIVQSGQKEQINRFRLSAEAESKASLALQALKKSRVKNWRW